MSIEDDKKVEIRNDFYTLLPNVLDDFMKRLSKIQIEAMTIGITNDEYNNISKKISDVKDYIVNLPYIK